jgi:hypothetical protein
MRSPREDLFRVIGTARLASTRPVDVLEHVTGSG